jgi:hypothetical protein
VEIVANIGPTRNCSLGGDSIPPSIKGRRIRGYQVLLGAAIGARAAGGDRDRVCVSGSRFRFFRFQTPSALVRKFFRTGVQLLQYHCTLYDVRALNSKKFRNSE